MKKRIVASQGFRSVDADQRREYMVRLRKPPSQIWRTFLNNHVKTLVSVDFFTVPTIFNRLAMLQGFVPGRCTVAPDSVLDRPTRALGQHAVISAGVSRTRGDRRGAHHGLAGDPAGIYRFRVMADVDAKLPESDLPERRLSRCLVRFSETTVDRIRVQACPAKPCYPPKMIDPNPRVRFLR